VNTIPPAMRAGYGNDKVQWVLHLRVLGFQFYVPPGIFLMHVPHPKSQSRVAWQDNARVADRLLSAFKAELAKMSFKKKTVPFCSREQRLSRTGIRGAVPGAVRRKDGGAPRRVPLPLYYNAILAGAGLGGLGLGSNQSDSSG
jgi:hypothetical protein